MPVPGGPPVEEIESVIRDAAARARLAGLGITGLGEGAEPGDVQPFAAAAGL
jgi:hypothetical protein